MTNRCITVEIRFRRPLCYARYANNASSLLSFRIQFNSEEQWTKALKFLLTNLKWGLAWVSSQFTKDENEH